MAVRNIVVLTPRGDFPSKAGLRHFGGPLGVEGDVERFKLALRSFGVREGGIMRLPLVEPPNGWRGFLADVAVVVIGVILALIAQAKQAH